MVIAELFPARGVVKVQSHATDKGKEDQIPISFRTLCNARDIQSSPSEDDDAEVKLSIPFLSLADEESRVAPSFGDPEVSCDVPLEDEAEPPDSSPSRRLVRPSTSSANCCKSSR